MPGLKGWLSEMNSNRRAQQCTAAYKSMCNLVSSGFSEFEPSLNIAGKFLQERLGSKGMLGANGMMKNSVHRLSNLAYQNCLKIEIRSKWYWIILTKG